MKWRLGWRLDEKTKCGKVSTSTWRMTRWYCFSLFGPHLSLSICFFQLVGFQWDSTLEAVLGPSFKHFPAATYIVFVVPVANREMMNLNSDYSRNLMDSQSMSLPLPGFWSGVLVPTFSPYSLSRLEAQQRYAPTWDDMRWLIGKGQHDGNRHDDNWGCTVWSKPVWNSLGSS